MKVVTFSRKSGQGVGWLEGDAVVDFTQAYRVFCAATQRENDTEASSILELLRAGLFTPETFSSVRRFVKDHRLTKALTVDRPRLLAPIPRSPRITALGLNYAAHAKETGKKPPKDPMFFVKLSTSVIGPEEPVIYPKGVGRVDHEVELAVIIGKGGRNISRRKAAEHIAGYTILNDVTARDMQTADMAAARPWYACKGIDTFGPMGPCIVLPDEIHEPVKLKLELRVNGEVKQSSNTRDLIFDIPELIHRLSKLVTLEVGEVISTGTPSGITPLKLGDVMEAEIERIGVLRNSVQAA
ncbi:MAG: fumarylacetoacetate hydrolase family protein [Armatimonadetes bacterium]|nr:fumarylacetoacetate hydrolase family protein [Armatimonadota bacterium]